MTRSAGLPSSTPPLVGRDRELAALRAHVEQIRNGRGAAVLVTGEAGTGKTVLVQAAANEAPDVSVLRCRGVEAEIALPYGGLHALLQPLADDLSALSDQQREALSAALALQQSAPASPIEVAMATLTLLASAAANQPLVILLDDAQWLDPASLTVFAFIGRRLDHDPVLLLATTRLVEEHPLPGSTEIHLGGVSSSDTQLLAEAHLGRPLLDGAADALHRATDGNPLAIIELVRTAAGDLERLGSIVDDPLPASALIDRAFASRVAALSDDARRAALVVAIALTDDADVIHPAVRALGLPESSLDEAERAEILVRRPGTVSFSHPLLRSVTYHQAAPADQRATHAALAETAREPSASAWHAAAVCVEADEEVAAALQAAAAELKARSGHLAAARASERAARISPDLHRRAERLYLAGRSARNAGRSSWARDLLDEAAGLSPEPRLRIRIEFNQIIQDAYSGAIENLTERHVALATAAEAIDPEYALTVWASTVNEFVLDGRIEGALEATDHLESLPGFADHQQARAIAAATRLLGGREPRGAAQALRDAAPDWAADPGIGSPTVIEALCWLGERELAALVSVSNLRSTRARGHLQAEMTGETCEIYRRFVFGEWAAGLVSAERARQLAVATGQTWQVALIDSSEALIAAAQGDEARARALISTTGAAAQASGYDHVAPYLASALGSLELGLGRAAEAVLPLERARDWCRAARYLEPALFPWPVDLVDAYLAAGRRDDAFTALRELERVATDYDRASALAAVDRLYGLLAREEEFDACFQRAFARHETISAPLEAGRAHLHYGMRLRRTGRRTLAREELRRARDEFGRLGARGWLAQADAELRAMGAIAAEKPSAAKPAATLTPQETAVANCVAQAMTNKEIAAQLFLTPKTIEWHLRQIYRKLGIKSRVQLAAMVRHSPVPTGGHS